MINEKGVEFKELSVRFGSKRALNQLSFFAKPGEITGLLGRNGAGKTTALRALTGLIDADSGRALINGREFSDARPGEIGVSLDSHFAPGRKVIDQLRATALAFDLRGHDIDRVIDLLELSRILDKRCSGLSLGMRGRLSIACAIISDPHTLILDEPVNGLDPDGIHWLHSFLTTAARSGKTVLVSSHYLHDLEKYIDHVVILQERVLLDMPWSKTEVQSLDEIFNSVTHGLEIS